MPTKTVTNLTLTRGLGLDGARYENALFTSAGVDSLAAGTILARSTASGKYILFVKGGSTDGNGVPKAVLAEAAAPTGAGDITVPVIIRGTITKESLVIDADGNSTNVDNAVKDQLRDYGITVISATELLVNEA